MIAWSKQAPHNTAETKLTRALSRVLVPGDPEPAPKDSKTGGKQRRRLCLAVAVTVSAVASALSTADSSGNSKPVSVPFHGSARVRRCLAHLRCLAEPLAARARAAASARGPTRLAMACADAAIQVYGASVRVAVAAVDTTAWTRGARAALALKAKWHRDSRPLLSAAILATTEMRPNESAFWEKAIPVLRDPPTMGAGAMDLAIETLVAGATPPPAPVNVGGAVHKELAAARAVHTRAASLAIVGAGLYAGRTRADAGSQAMFARLARATTRALTRAVRDSPESPGASPALAELSARLITAGSSGIDMPEFERLMISLLEIAERAPAREFAQVLSSSTTLDRDFRRRLLSASAALLNSPHATARRNARDFIMEVLGTKARAWWIPTLVDCAWAARTLAAAAVATTDALKRGGGATELFAAAPARAFFAARASDVVPLLLRALSRRGVHKAACRDALCAVLATCPRGVGIMTYFECLDGSGSGTHDASVWMSEAMMAVTDWAPMAPASAWEIAMRPLIDTFLKSGGSNPRLVKFLSLSSPVFSAIPRAAAAALTVATEELEAAATAEVPPQSKTPSMPLQQHRRLGPLLVLRVLSSECLRLGIDAKCTKDGTEMNDGERGRAVLPRLRHALLRTIDSEGLQREERKLAAELLARCDISEALPPVMLRLRTSIETLKCRQEDRQRAALAHLNLALYYLCHVASVQPREMLSPPGRPREMLGTMAETMSALAGDARTAAIGSKESERALQSAQRGADEAVACVLGASVGVLVEGATAGPRIAATARACIDAALGPGTSSSARLGPAPLAPAALDGFARALAICVQKLPPRAAAWCVSGSRYGRESVMARVVAAVQRCGAGPRRDALVRPLFMVLLRAADQSVARQSRGANHPPPVAERPPRSPEVIEAVRDAAPLLLQLTARVLAEAASVPSQMAAMQLSGAVFSALPADIKLRGGGARAMKAAADRISALARGGASAQVRELAGSVEGLAVGHVIAVGALPKTVVGEPAT